MLSVFAKERYWALALLGLVYFGIAEGLSLLPDPSPCLVDIEGYKSAYYQHDEKGCAPAHVIVVWGGRGLTKWIDTNDKVIVAGATLIIAFFTITLWRSTDRMRSISAQQAAIAQQMSVAADDANKKVREIERAYLTSGGGSGQSADGRKIFQLEVANYGKTPAYLLDYAVIICAADDVGPIPKYLLPGHERSEYPDRIAPAGHKKIDLMPVPPVEKPVVYGRVWYQDIWKETHYFSFILAITPTGTHPDLSRTLGLASVADTYTDWT